jgi:hypothetical protein
LGVHEIASFFHSVFATSIAFSSVCKSLAEGRICQRREKADPRRVNICLYSFMVFKISCWVSVHRSGNRDYIGILFKAAPIMYHYQSASER